MRFDLQRETVRHPFPYCSLEEPQAFFFSKKSNTRKLVEIYGDYAVGASRRHSRQLFRERNLDRTTPTQNVRSIPLLNCSWARAQNILVIATLASRMNSIPISIKTTMPIAILTTFPIQFSIKNFLKMYKFVDCVEEECFSFVFFFFFFLIPRRCADGRYDDLRAPLIFRHVSSSGSARLFRGVRLLKLKIPLSIKIHIPAVVVRVKLLNTQKKKHVI